MSEKRILHVLGGLDMGGAETFVMNLYRKIDKSKIQFDFIKHTKKAQFFDEEIRNKGGRIYSCPRYKGYNHFAYKHWWKTFFKEHPEYKIIHGHVRSTAAIYLKIAKSFGLKTIIHSHSTHNTKGFCGLVKAVLQFPVRVIADYFFACSQGAGEWLFGRKITKQKNFFIIPNVVDTGQFAYNQALRQEMRKKLNLENNFVIGHIGRLDIPKNHTFLLKIFAKVYKQKPQARLLLLGEGPLKEKLAKQAKELNIDKVVYFCGNQDAAAYLQAMDIFVFPSLYEGLPVSLVEAQISGLCCIIADNITQEVDLEEGLLTRLSLTCQPEVWANKILAKQEKPRKSQQVAACQKGFDVLSLTKQMENFYTRERL